VAFDTTSLCQQGKTAVAESLLPISDPKAIIRAANAKQQRAIQLLDPTTVPLPPQSPPLLQWTIKLAFPLVTSSQVVEIEQPIA
jgi:hypothetical protein